MTVNHKLYSTAGKLEGSLIIRLSLTFIKRLSLILIFEHSKQFQRWQSYQCYS